MQFILQSVSLFFNHPCPYLKRKFAIFYEINKNLKYLKPISASYVRHKLIFKTNTYKGFISYTFFKTRGALSNVDFDEKIVLSMVKKVIYDIFRWLLLLKLRNPIPNSQELFIPQLKRVRI